MVWCGRIAGKDVDAVDRNHGEQTAAGAVAQAYGVAVARGAGDVETSLVSVGGERAAGRPVNNFDVGEHAGAGGRGAGEQHVGMAISLLGGIGQRAVADAPVIAAVRCIAMAIPEEIHALISVGVDVIV